MDAKLEAKLAKKLIKRPLVGKLAEKAKMLKNAVFFNTFGPLVPPTWRPNRPKVGPKAIKNPSKDQSKS